MMISSPAYPKFISASLTDPGLFCLFSWGSTSGAIQVMAFPR
nr:MAG TPA: hypothetical protein [Caudoviricetes sp.]